MHIKKSLPNKSFTKMSNKIWADQSLSDGAKVLYGFLASLPNGKTLFDGYISRALGISSAVVTRRKKELKDAGLILLVQLAPRVHDLYIGHYDMPAKYVKQVWDEEGVESDRSKEVG